MRLVADNDGEVLLGELLVLETDAVDADQDCARIM